MKRATGGDKKQRKTGGVDSKIAESIAESEIMTNASMELLRGKELPELKATDEDLGCYNLLRILPETWHNIPWVVQNSAE